MAAANCPWVLSVPNSANHSLCIISSTFLFFISQIKKHIKPRECDVPKVKLLESSDVGMQTHDGDEPGVCAHNPHAELRLAQNSIRQDTIHF